MTKTYYRLNRPFHLLNLRRYRRRALVAVIALVIVVTIAILIASDINRLRHKPNRAAVVTGGSHKIAGPEIFKTLYFQFSDVAKWKLIASESTASKFTYQLYVSGLPAHSFSVYINQVPIQDQLAATNALPVTIRSGNALEVGELSDNCGKLYKPTDLKQIKMVSLSGTSILCVPDSPQQAIAVAQAGGDYNLKLQRQNGQTANYVILYRNLSITPDPAPFERIMSTFKAL